MPHPYNNIPRELRQSNNWVVWGIGGLPPKAPFNPSSLLVGEPTHAKAGVPQTWSSYRNAVECVRRGLAQGIGYEFDGQNDLYGVDLDHVIDHNGQLSPEALAIVDNLATYAEISPSGTGVHLFVYAPGVDIQRHRKKDGFVEIYQKARYFTVTGKAIAPVRPIETRTSELQAVHDTYLQPQPIQQTLALPITAPALKDSELERFLRTGLKRDRVFAELWEGARFHDNESSNDQALMNKLAYWGNGDERTMIGAFLKSPYHAQKSDYHQKKSQRTDYLQRTVRQACATAASTAAADHEFWLKNRKIRKPRKKKEEIR